MKKIFCIFIMFCICIVNAWADNAPQCPEQTQTKINEWQALCAHEEGEAAEELQKCIEYFDDMCGYLNDSNTDTAVASVSEGGCEAFVGKKFDKIVEYLDDQVEEICAVKKVDCPYPLTIALWKLQCADKDIMNDITKFEEACNNNGDKKSVPYPGDARTLEMIMGDLSKRADDDCPSMPKVDEGCNDEDAKGLIKKWRTQCEYVDGFENSDVKSRIDMYEQMCKDNFSNVENRTGEESTIQELVDKGCSVEEFIIGNLNTEQRTTLYTNITANGLTLDGIIGNLDLSVWKNADGKFNTARLASDSIAGVVLGTAGGLITSSVMKKHQAADGFEDLKCVVGGQSVAGWGDVFNVGIQ